MNQQILQLGKQLGAIWKQLGLNQRISVVLAAAAVFGGLISLAVWSGRVDYTLLYGKLDDAEASRVIAALNDAKVPYKASSGSIYVPKDQVYTMRMQLAGRGIPRGDGVGFEIFDKPNFGISDFVQRANYVRAVQGELARTISQLDQIEAARVMIVMPENRLLVDSQKHPTASIFVRVKGNGQLPPQSVNSIRFLVANAVEGLKANNVSVVDNLGNVLSENTDTDSIAGLTTTQLMARRNLEQYLSKKAEGMLEKVLGSGQAVVRVAAEINLDSMNRHEEKLDPDGQVVRTATVNDENNDSLTASSNGGVAGVGTNASTETATNNPATPMTNSKLKKKVTSTEYEISKVSSDFIQGAGGLKRISAAVFIASKFEGAGTARKAVPRTQEEIEKLKRIVQSALGIQNGADATRKDEITLEEMPFNDQFQTEITQQLDKQERHQMIWDTGRTLLYPGLALIMFMTFLRSFKRTPVENIPLGMPVGQMALNGGNGNGNGNGDLHLPDGQTTPGVVTPDVLNRLIRENPENMSQAIRSWMTNGKATAK
ncbi:MAG TPA: flagellar basal-body MS-ring/collar protein FliF [Verrucomicrobiae bacterium]|nr:flagellar basal-body MS-ring/collar protein FliF [Verrucomicrobiae bacterium]